MEETGGGGTGGGTSCEPAPPKRRCTALIIIRHAERLDDHRIPGGFVHPPPRPGRGPYDWRYDTEAGRARPWDPPLSFGGIDQAEKFGALLPHLIEDFKLPPLGAAYASPVVRCAETGLAALQAHDAEVVKMKKEREEREARQRAEAARGKKGGGGKKKKKGGMAFGKKKVHREKGPDLATTMGTIHFGSGFPSLSSALHALGIDGPDAADDDAAATEPMAPSQPSAHLSPVSEDAAVDADIDACTSTDNPDKTVVRLRLEQGLVECIHQQWFDQWAQCIETNVVPSIGAGVVGEHRTELEDGRQDEKKLDADEDRPLLGANNLPLHPMARGPVTACFPDPADMVGMLAGVARSYREEKSTAAGGSASIILVPERDRDQHVLPLDVLVDRVDTTEHITPFEFVPENYQYGTYEAGKPALDRQHSAIRSIAARHPGQTVLCVTHFVPCAHLYGRLTGRDFMKEHGRADYTGFSVYVHNDGREGEKHTDWRALVVNDRRHLRIPRQEETAGRPTRKSKYNLRSKLYGF